MLICHSYGNKTHCPNSHRKALQTLERHSPISPARRGRKAGMDVEQGHHDVCSDYMELRVHDLVGPSSSSSPSAVPPIVFPLSLSCSSSNMVRHLCFRFQDQGAAQPCRLCPPSKIRIASGGGERLAATVKLTASNTIPIPIKGCPYQ